MSRKGGRKGLLYLKSLNGVLVLEGKLASSEPSLTESELFHFHLQHTCHVKPAFDICAALGQPRGFWWLLDCFVPSLVPAEGQLQWLLQLLGVVPFCLGAALASWGSGNEAGKDFVPFRAFSPQKRAKSLALGEPIWWFMSNAGGICSPFSPLASFPPGTCGVQRGGQQAVGRVPG